MRIHTQLASGAAPSSVVTALPPVVMGSDGGAPAHGGDGGSGSLTGMVAMLLAFVSLGRARRLHKGRGVDRVREQPTDLRRRVRLRGVRAHARLGNIVPRALSARTRAVEVDSPDVRLERVGHVADAVVAAGAVALAVVADEHLADGAAAVRAAHNVVAAPKESRELLHAVGAGRNALGARCGLLVAEAAGARAERRRKAVVRKLLVVPRLEERLDDRHRIVGRRRRVHDVLADVGDRAVRIHAQRAPSGMAGGRSGERLVPNHRLRAVVGALHVVERHDPRLPQIEHRAGGDRALEVIVARGQSGLQSVRNRPVRPGGKSGT